MTEQTVSYKKFRATLRLGEHTTVTSVADDPRSAVAAVLKACMCGELDPYIIGRFVDENMELVEVEEVNEG